MTPTTPTAAAIAAGRATLELVRTAAGGPVLTALRSFDASGTSAMTGLKAPRQLQILALFPQYFKIDEAPLPGYRGPMFHTTMGLENRGGWLTGANLGGDGKSRDPGVAKRALTRAARQSMTGVLAGINAPWLMDTGQFTMTDAGRVTAGDDRGALQVIIDGPDGRVGRLLVDPGTHLPRRLIQPPQPGGGGGAAVSEIVFTYSDFQAQDGVQLPHAIVRQVGETRTTWVIKKYVLNPKIPARRFVAGQR